MKQIWRAVVPKAWQLAVRHYQCRQRQPKATFVVYASAARRWLAWSQERSTELEMSVQELQWELPSLMHPSSLGMRYTFRYFRPYLDIPDPAVGIESRPFMQRVANRFRDNNCQPLILYSGSKRTIKGVLSAEGLGFHWQFSDALQMVTGRTDFLIATISDQAPFIHAWHWEEGRITPISVRIVDNGNPKQPHPRPDDWWKTPYR